MSRDDCFSSPPADAPEFLDWIFLGQGSYNRAYFNSIKNQVFKFPRYTQDEFFFDDPLRLVKIWNKLNLHISPARLYSLQDNNGNWHRGWMAPFVHGQAPQDDQMAVLINCIYIATRRIFMDGCNPRNSIAIQTHDSEETIATCIDPGMVVRLDGEYHHSQEYRPTSPTSIKILNFGDEYEKYWHQYIVGINKNSQKFEPYPKSTHMIRAILYLECGLLVQLAYTDEHCWEMVREYARLLSQYPGLTVFLSHLFNQQKTLPDLELVHLFFLLQKEDSDHIKKVDDVLQFLALQGLLEDFFENFHANLFLQERWQYFLKDILLLNKLITFKENNIPLKSNSMQWKQIAHVKYCPKHTSGRIATPPLEKLPSRQESSAKRGIHDKKHFPSWLNFFHWPRHSAITQNQTHLSPSLTFF